MNKSFTSTSDSSALCSKTTWAILLLLSPTPKLFSLVYVSSRQIRGMFMQLPPWLGSSQINSKPANFPDPFQEYIHCFPSYKIARSRRKGDDGKRRKKETWTVKFIMCPELAWVVMLGADFLCNAKVVLNFAEGTFSTHQCSKANTVVSGLEK